MRRARGFTLIEVLVAMAITAILLSAIGGVLVSFITTQRKVEATLLRERVGSSILDLISRDLQGLYCYDLQGVFKGIDERSGSGDSDRFEFVTTRDPSVRGEPSEEEADAEEARRRQGAVGELPTNEADAVIPREPPQLTKVGYSARTSRGHPDLLTVFRSESLYIPPIPQPGAAPGTAGAAAAAAPAQADASALPAEAKDRFMEVYDRVRSFGVRYLFTEKDQESEWRDAWDLDDKIPAAIEITLEIIPDPKDLQKEAFGPERPRRLYKTVVSIPVTYPKPTAPAAGTNPQGGTNLPAATEQPR